MAFYHNDSIGSGAGFSNYSAPAAVPVPTFVGGGYSGDGLGGIGALIALAALSGGAFGGFGRGHDHGHGAPFAIPTFIGGGHSHDRCCDHDRGNDNAPFIGAILSNLNGIATSVPTTALETQGTINTAISSLALGVQQGLSSVKDSVQVAGTTNLLATNAVNTSVLTSALQTVIAIKDDGDKTRAQGQEIKDLINSVNTQNLNRELAVAEGRLARCETDSRMREVEVNVTQTVNQQQVQAQAQLQQQQQANFLAGILAEVRNLAGDIQAVKQGQVIFNSGTMAASGTQAANNTKVA